jgi:hypothetical protein
MTRTHTTSRTPTGRAQRRRRDRLAAAGVVLLAIVAGVTAAHFGTHKAWEQPVHVQGNK